MLHVLANLQSLCGTKTSGRAVLGDLVLWAPQRLRRLDRALRSDFISFFVRDILLVGEGICSLQVEVGLLLRAAFGAVDRILPWAHADLKPHSFHQLYAETAILLVIILLIS